MLFRSHPTHHHPTHHHPTHRHATDRRQAYELQLIDEVTWDKLAKFALQPHEWVMAARLVHLRDDSYTSGKVAVPFVAVGTAIQMGEDEICRGRLLLFEVMLRT